MIAPVRVEEKEEEHGDGDGARDRREVERRPEEPDELHPPIDEYGEEERDRRLDRDDEDHVVEVVADRRAEVVLVEARLGEQVPVVREADVVRVRAERAAVPVPVRDAHPRGHQDRQHEEEPEDDDHRREEQPPGRPLAAANPGLPEPDEAARHFAYHRGIPRFLNVTSKAPERALRDFGVPRSARCERCSYEPYD